MSKNLMETSPGGEQTQYEAEAEGMRPHAKQSGQLASDENKSTLDPNNTNERNQGQHKVAETRQQQADVDAQKMTGGDQGLSGRTDVGGQGNSAGGGGGKDEVRYEGKMPGSYGGDVGKGDEM